VHLKIITASLGKTAQILIVSKLIPSTVTDKGKHATNNKTTHYINPSIEILINVFEGLYHVT